MDKLPMEVLEQILLKLRPSELNNAANVNKAFRNIISQEIFMENYIRGFNENIQMESKISTDHPIFNREEFTTLNIFSQIDTLTLKLIGRHAIIDNQIYFNRAIKFSISEFFTSVTIFCSAFYRNNHPIGTVKSFKTTNNYKLEEIDDLKFLSYKEMSKTLENYYICFYTLDGRKDGYETFVNIIENEVLLKLWENGNHIMTQLIPSVKRKKVLVDLFNGQDVVKILLDNKKSMEKSRAVSDNLSHYPKRKENANY